MMTTVSLYHLSYCIRVYDLRQQVSFRSHHYSPIITPAILQTSLWWNLLDGLWAEANERADAGHARRLPACLPAAKQSHSSFAFVTDYLIETDLLGRHKTS